MPARELLKMSFYGDIMQQAPYSLWLHPERDEHNQKVCFRSNDAIIVFATTNDRWSNFMLKR